MESLKKDFPETTKKPRADRGPSGNTTSQLLSTEEVAKRFQMSLWWVRQQVRLGCIPVVVRKPFRFDGKVIDELIKVQMELKNINNNCALKNKKKGKSTSRKALRKEPLW